MPEKKNAQAQSLEEQIAHVIT